MNEDFPPFKEFPKIFRLSRECIITEKIDGTNAQVLITEDGKIFAGSRSRWITPKDDNYGFARWVEGNREELLKLGVGSHFGEWWGSGCQRGYNLPKGEKRFSLFNVTRWDTPERPSCCHVVPTLWKGMFTTDTCAQQIENLATYGSLASPGFMNPEGIVCFHVPSGFLFKKTVIKDEEPKTKTQ